MYIHAHIHAYIQGACRGVRARGSQYGVPDALSGLWQGGAVVPGVRGRTPRAQGGGPSLTGVCVCVCVCVCVFVTPRVGG